MDDLSQSLNCCKTGCLSGEIMINHLMYADDLMLLSPSATGLRELLRTCEKYSKEHAIIYNSKKSSVLICKNRATMHVPRRDKRTVQRKTGLDDGLDRRENEGRVIQQQ